MRCNVLHLGAVAVLFAPLAIAGTLRVGVPQVDGNQVVLPVLLEGDTAGGVAALDFTLNYDPAVFTPVRTEASEAAQAARKQVESNEVSPGNYVVMMFGMNQTTVSNGQVAEITLTKRTQPASNQSDITIAETTFASIEGAEIASEGSSQTVTFPPPPSDDGGGNNPPPADDTPPTPDSPNEIPKPVPPVNTPESPTPTVPSVPGGTPSQPDDPKDETPRVTPMTVASSIVDERNGSDTNPRTSGVARMNRAAQRLENSRAALNATPRADGGASDGSGEVRDNVDGNPPVPSPSHAEHSPNVETDGEMKISSASPHAISAREVTPISVANETTDSSGIPPSSRRALIAVASMVAVALVVYRFARKSAR